VQVEEPPPRIPKKADRSKGVKPAARTEPPTREREMQEETRASGKKERKEGGHAGGEQGMQDGDMSLRMCLSIEQSILIGAWTSAELSEWLRSVDMSSCANAFAGILVHIVLVY
jgi:hypothetical protein